MNLKGGVLALLLVASGAHAEDWTKFGESAQMSFQFDAESMQSRGSVETVWVKTLNKEPYGAKSYLSRESVDCNDRDAITILSQTSYSANGNVIDSFIHTERQPAPPGSVSASLIAMLCGAAK